MITRSSDGGKIDCTKNAAVLSEATTTVRWEMPRPIPRNSVESDRECTSRIYFNNAGGKVTLTLYNVTLTSQKPCDCSKTNGLNEVYVVVFF